MEGGCGAGDGENASADHCANAKGDQAPGTQGPFEAFTFNVRVSYQLIYVFSLQKLVHVNAPV